MTDMDASCEQDRATHEQSQQAVSAVPVGIPSAMVAAIWRCGVSTGVEVADRVLAEMSKSRSKAVKRFHDMLDEEMQRVMDGRHGFPVETYSDAFDAHKRINIAAAQAIEAHRAETERLGAKHESAVATGHASKDHSLRARLSVGEGEGNA